MLIKVIYLCVAVYTSSRKVVGYQDYPEIKVRYRMVLGSRTRKKVGRAFIYQVWIWRGSSITWLTIRDTSYIAYG